MTISDELYSICPTCECPLLYLEKIEVGNARGEVLFRDYILKCKKKSTCPKAKMHQTELFESKRCMSPLHYHL